MGYLVFAGEPISIIPLDPRLQKRLATATDAPLAAARRTWNDATGRFSIEAEFVSADDERVKLRKKDGSTVDVPIKKLSKADRDWIRDHKSPGT
jgi:hypothetical protein